MVDVRNINFETLKEKDLSHLSFNDLFDNTMVMSGTPKESQRMLKRKYPDMVGDCSPARAMAGNLICKPVLNLIKIHNKSEVYNGIRSMIRRERELMSNTNEKFQIRSLICCSSIEEAQDINSQILRDGLYHSIVLHTEKEVELEDGSKGKLVAQVDGVRVPLSSNKDDEKDIFDYLDEIDNNSCKSLDDGKPILVIQVDMISEGVNSVKSFNSVLIMSSGDIKQMQQIGRVLRDFILVKDGVEYNKIEHGHASVYCTYKEKEDLRDIFMGLTDNRLNTCFTWGSHCEVRTGSAPKADPNAVAKYIPIKWEPIEGMKDIAEIYNCRLEAMIRGHYHSVLNTTTVYNTLFKNIDTVKAILNTKIKLKKRGVSKGHKGTGKGTENGIPTPKDVYAEEKGAKNTQNATPSEEVIIEDDEASGNILIGLILTHMSDLINRGGKRTYNRPLFDNDHDFYKNVLKEMGFPSECVEDIDKFLYENNYYEVL